MYTYEQRPFYRKEEGFRLSTDTPCISKTKHCFVRENHETVSICYQLRSFRADFGVDKTKFGQHSRTSTLLCDSLYLCVYIIVVFRSSIFLFLLAFGLWVFFKKEFVAFCRTLPEPLKYLIPENCCCLLSSDRLLISARLIITTSRRCHLQLYALSSW